ncbi:hypothetical protein DIT68_13685 [Brumimicrobium oceani]|uniref:Uncharacterized protein n=2 Tax=Brumimicrobium oceani TaxID=2100725 RepID=A0A2U2X5B2_9FLAO|nr:hypothetical protein DIT68_13685 [Brumimicrobium oceani]
MISMSEVYPLSPHPDSAAIPELKEMNASEIAYFTLNAEYRTRFLDGTNTSENDTIFIYDYVNNSLSTIPVSLAKLVAMLSPYEIGGKYELTQHEYMIGFEVDELLLNQGNHDEASLVYVGQKNPFLKDKLKNIEWKEINSSEIPYTRSRQNHPEMIPEKAYTYKNEDKSYFIQNFLRYNYVWAKHLLIIDAKTKTKIIDTMLYSGEGSDFTELDSQYTGQLFKEKPEVIFGFNYHSFGCSLIYFMDKKEQPVEVKCDNRH